MNKKVSAVLGSGIIIMSSLANTAWASECLNARGRIVNNAQAGGATLGVATLRLGEQRFKCAVSGDPQLSDPEAFPPQPNYRHTLVCNDKVEDGEPQSQITFDTFFVSLPEPTGACPGGESNPFGPISFTFEELSIPDPTTARGTFVGVDRATSYINITGDYNCMGGIKMRFRGVMCFTE